MMMMMMMMRSLLARLQHQRPVLCLLLVLATVYTRARAEEATPSFQLEIKPSTIDTQGADGIFVSPKSRGTVAEGTVLTIYGDRTVTALSIANTEYEQYAMDAPGSTPGMVRTGAGWMGYTPSSVTFEPVGHLIRDASTIEIGEGVFPGLQGLIDLVNKYMEEANARANVMLASDMYEARKSGSSSSDKWEVVASRDIEPGEELAWNSGPQYWLSMIMRSHPDPLVRLLVYLYTTHLSPHLFPNGYLFMEEEESGGGLVLSSTNKAPTENYCYEMLTDLLGMKGRGDREEEARFGFYPEMSARERLTRLMHMVVTEAGTPTTVGYVAEATATEEEEEVDEEEGVEEEDAVATE